MTTPLSDERLTARTIAQFRHWVALSDSTEDADERRRLDAMLAASVPDLLDEVERLRARVAELEDIDNRVQAMADRMAAQAADNLLQAREAERRVAELDERVQDLQARNAELVAVLRSVEWSLASNYARMCPCCYSYQAGGHAPDCALDAALRGADE